MMPQRSIHLLRERILEWPCCVAVYWLSHSCSWSRSWMKDHTRGTSSCTAPRRRDCNWRWCLAYRYAQCVRKLTFVARHRWECIACGCPRSCRCSAVQSWQPFASSLWIRCNSPLGNGWSLTNTELQCLTCKIQINGDFYSLEEIHSSPVNTYLYLQYQKPRVSLSAQNRSSGRLWSNFHCRPCSGCR